MDAKFDQVFDALSALSGRNAAHDAMLQTHDKAIGALSTRQNTSVWPIVIGIAGVMVAVVVPLISASFFFSVLLTTPLRENALEQAAEQDGLQTQTRDFQQQTVDRLGKLEEQGAEHERDIGRHQGQLDKLEPRFGRIEGWLGTIGYPGAPTIDEEG